MLHPSSCKGRACPTAASCHIPRLLASARDFKLKACASSKMPLPGAHRSYRAALLVAQRLHAGQLLAFEELQRRAAAGGDVGNLVGHAGGFDGSYTVAATDNGDCC